MEVLVSAPFRQDEAVIVDFLRQGGLHARRAGVEELLSVEPAELGALVMTQDCLGGRFLNALHGRLLAQEAWSELPIILLLDAEHHTPRTLAWLTRAMPRARPVILQRPARPAAFSAAVNTSLAARRRQFEVRDLLAWHVELQLEMNHRVKNALANALAIFHMARRRSGDLDHLAHTYEERLLALTRAYSALAKASEAQDFAEIAHACVAPHAGPEARVHIDGPMLLLKPSAAVTLALCLHELAVNAVEHGALAKAGGEAWLTWTLDGDEARVNWRERPSFGPPPAEKGYGLSFVEAAAARGLKGRCRIENSGGEYACVLELPMKSLSPASAPRNRDLAEA